MSPLSYFVVHHSFPDPGGIAPESSTEASIENSILPANTTDGTLHSSIADPGGIALESCTETSIEAAILLTNTTDGTLDSAHVAPCLSNLPKESIVIPLLRSNAVCVGCGKSTSHAYHCKFCDAPLHIVCVMDPEEMGHGAHYTCPK
jgi:hypothetical protein